MNSAPPMHHSRAATFLLDVGFVKVLCKAGTDSILGATIVAADAGSMISEVSLAIQTGTGLAALSTVIHPYPTQVNPQYESLIGV